MPATGRGRVESVQVKVEQWAAQLIDLGPRNTLLHYRDTKTATLDLSSARPESLNQLLSGRKTRLNALFPLPEEQKRACERARNLHRKMVEFEEEQGVEVGRIARGLLLLAAPPARGPTQLHALRSPLILQPMLLEPRTPAENDYNIDVTGAPEINPVLLYVLNRHYGIDFDPDSMAEKLNALLDEIDDPEEQITSAYTELDGAISRHGMAASVEARTLAGLFSFEKLPMVKDLRESVRLLADHDVIAAAAGFQPASDLLQADAASYRPPSVDAISPRDEFLVLDADSSQQQAIQAVLDGRHAVIQGPPGTGKSQTIANVIASAVALGKRVLFVTEKRAAIEAVTDRLALVDLDHVVFDLHEQKLNKRQVAQQVAKSLDRASREPPAEANGVHDRLARRRQQLLHHVRQLSQVRQPWGRSAYDVYVTLLELPERSRSDIRFRGRQLDALSGPVLANVEQDLTAFINTGGLGVRRGDSPWSRCGIRDESALEQVIARLDLLTGRAWSDTQTQLRALVARAGLQVPSDLTGWQDVLGLLDGVNRSLADYGQDIFAAPLADMCFATADRSWRREHPRPIGWWRRLALRRQAVALRRAGKTDRRTLHRELSSAVQQLGQWRQRALGDGGPAAVPGLAESLSRFNELRNQLAAVAMAAQLDRPECWPEEQVTTTLAELKRHEQTLFRMPLLNRLSDTFTRVGLAPLIDELVVRDADVAEAIDMFRYAWHQSLLDEFQLRDPYLAQFSGRQHSTIVQEFRQADSEHLALNAQRVRRRVAERIRRARDANRQQNALILAQANRKRGHLSLRRLVAEAPDILLAARPCWAMSPVVVSRLLPARRLFDLVIFDEASQIEPYDAMASIMRGRQLVVAGDDKQLPPTTFFRRTLLGGASEDDDDPENEERNAGVAPIGDYESILACLVSLIPNLYTLRWHYRSQDERLIAFSNHEIYDDALVTFPGRDVESPLRLDVVDGLAAPGTGGMADEELRRVVELVVDHVRHRGGDTLGVITTGLPQAARIEAALRRATQETPELADFQARMQGPTRRLFIKSIENVQGDERDTIIFSIGRSKAPDGRLAMRFGPINHEGGERRLNVAVTRARKHMSVVSAFSSEDMSPNSPTRGPELLRRFLQLAAEQAQPAFLGRARPVEMNGFERSIHDALVTAGVPVIPQWGVSGYRIDFALGHPDRPGRMVLAVEADGHRYHSSASARDRDRLRQDHLERLGWEFHRVWASDWFNDPQGQTGQIIDRWRQAIAKSDAFVGPAPDECSASDTSKPEEDAARRRGRRPPIPQRAKIDDYAPGELIAVCRWLLRDELQVDRETRIEQAIRELGFRRRGKRIVDQINTALDRAERLEHTEDE